MMTNDRSIPRSLTLFVILYMSICSLAALNQGNTEFLMYAAMMVVFILLTLAINMRVHFTRSALWLLAIWGCLHMLGGTVPIAQRFVLGDGSPVLYSLRIHPDLPRYDQLTHAFGFFGATVACWESVRVLLSARKGVALSVVAVLMGMGLGALNEVFEFAATRVTDTNVGGYTNTGWDLVSNTIGALCAGVWCLNRRV
jgi:uncharacterized membrane protein YjdF